ncbi:sensor domain-containing diguanylate cyclase [Pseudoalteromonas phenolica]|uniref:sensor domain-containing diguanylate cyclase n=1 Tax=Pseudoalteromonas phenolica TaxID=161398 RepID=UPI00126EE385|nr:sensor domain-containing diguanylate cyclase [Pseudoalteromonas phenolica]TMO54261.1 diguanylate cyclase [Pseudoalteromonas phenolica]
MDQNLFLLTVHRQFNRLLSDLALSSDIAPFLKEVISTVERFLPGCKVSILTLNKKQLTLHSGAENNLPDFYNDAIEGVKIGENVGSCGAAAFLNKPIIVGDINTHENWQPYLALTQEANLHACWSIPFTNSHKEVMGTFAIYHHEKKVPTEAEIEIVKVAALITSVAMEKLKLEEQLIFSATHDELTRLHNRAYLNEAGENFLSFCSRNEMICSVLFIDLNKFKRVNDELGHKVGDELLIDVAKVIKEQTRDSDISSRFGGDEFIIIMKNTSENDGESVAKRIYKAIMQSVPRKILELEFGLSIGIAKMSSTDKKSLKALIHTADEAMYFAKNNNLGVYAKQ